MRIRIIRALPGIAKDSNGEPLISPELVIVFKLPKKDDPKGSNVTVRGVTPIAFEMRPYVKLVDGRMFRPGVNEVIVARRIRDRFVNTARRRHVQVRPADMERRRRLRRAAARPSIPRCGCDVDYLGSARKRDGVLVPPGAVRVDRDGVRVDQGGDQG